MSAPTRLLYNSDIWDAATIAAATETGDLVADNLVSDFIRKPWRPTGLSAEAVVFDLGAATAVDMVGILGHNLTAAATVTHEANSSDSWGAPPFQENQTILTDADGVVVPKIFYFPTITDYRYHRFIFTDAANPDGYIDIGRIKAQSFYEVARDADDGYEIEEADLSQGNDVPGKMGYYRVKEVNARFALSFSFPASAQALKFRAIYRKVGRHTPILLALDPDNNPSDQSFFCRFITGPKTVYLATDISRQGTFVFEEVVE